MTSSKMSTLFSRWVIKRRAARYPPGAGTQPILPTTGSTMTQAISCLNFLNACSSASVSLKGKASVNWMNSSGTPAEPGIPSVAMPEPAFTKERVGVSVVATLKFHNVFALGVGAREPDRGHGRFRA